MGGSGDPYLYLIFILSQLQERGNCQLKPSVNLPEAHETTTATSTCGELSPLIHANYLDMMLIDMCVRSSSYQSSLQTLDEENTDGAIKHEMTEIDVSFIFLMCEEDN